MCDDCPVGFYCEGGDFDIAGATPVKTACPGQPINMTTLGQRAASKQQCGEWLVGRVGRNSSHGARRLPLRAPLARGVELCC